MIMEILVLEHVLSVMSKQVNLSGLDIFEPAKISNAVKKLNLKHVAITSVDRDDLKDGGSNHFYKVVKLTREKNPNTSIEVLTPDFLRKGEAYKKNYLKADIDVFNHNIETVPSLILQFDLR